MLTLVHIPTNTVMLTYDEASQKTTLNAGGLFAKNLAKGISIPAYMQDDYGTDRVKLDDPKFFKVFKDYYLNQVLKDTKTEYEWRKLPANVTNITKEAKGTEKSEPKKSQSIFKRFLP